MTPDQIDTAIAEHIGWTHIQGIADFRLYGFRPNSDGEKYRKAAVPQFHKCLNAMHEAEKSLKQNLNQWTDYLAWLNYEPEACAMRRARGFLRTVNKYQVPEKLSTHCAV